MWRCFNHIVFVGTATFRFLRIRFQVGRKYHFSARKIGAKSEESTKGAKKHFQNVTTFAGTRIRFIIFNRTPVKHRNSNQRPHLEEICFTLSCNF